MQLSIIIVNFNVKYFLEQCLSAVHKAAKGLLTEVLVVDNASTDGSVTYLQPKFEWVQFMANQTNVGFGKANNQALQQCTGRYVLFLNPDTIVAEDCFTECIAFMENTPGAGALGIRMVDGQGLFLPESKRAFPSPLTSFFKLVGLTGLFPTSSLFARYTLGHLDEHSNHEVDVLAGAFLLGRRELLLALNGFDETFFMYGEDVDLSYRIQQNGYKNYYFSGSTIIHFKGESTKKGSLNYVRMFYQAMSIFVQKHYGGGKASLFSFFIQVAIWIRAALTAFSRLIIAAGLPLIDAVIIFSTFQLVNQLWINTVRSGKAFVPGLVNIALPVFTMLFLVTAWLAGLYDRKYKPSKAFYPAVVAIVVMLATYALLPERFRFSRGVILFSGMAATASIILLRWLLLQFNVVEEYDEENKTAQTLVVGTLEEYNEVAQLLAAAGVEKRLMGRVAVEGAKEDAITTLNDMPALLKNLPLREVIFCEGFLSFKTIIQQTQMLAQHISARFHAASTGGIVGSDSKDSSGEFVAQNDTYALSKPAVQRRKRIVDLIVALGLLLTFPLQLVLCGPRVVYYALLVLVGKRTWVGYTLNNAHLPVLRPGIISTSGHSLNTFTIASTENLLRIDEWYARYYHWKQDVKLLLRHYKHLG